MVEYSFSLVDFEMFLLVLVRITCFMSVAPFYGMRNVPAQVKVALSFFIAILIAGSVDGSAVGYTGILGYAVIVIREGITGLLIGLVASICNSIILFAGNIIDMDIGLSMAQEFDPMMNTQVTISGNLYQYLILLLLVVTDMHHSILRAFVDSFELIPLNGQNFQWDSLLNTMTRFMTDSFVIAFRIILPVFACTMVLNCILGVMAKVAPQMNMFAVGMQMKILVGFAVLLLTVTLLPGIGDFVFKEMREMITSAINGMR